MTGTGICSNARSYLLKPGPLRWGFCMRKRTSGEMHRLFAYKHATSVMYKVLFNSLNLGSDRTNLMVTAAHPGLTQIWQKNRV